MEYTKDTLFSFRSTIRGKDSKGRDRNTFYLDKEHVMEFAKAVAAAKDNEGGVKLIFHTGKKIHGESGRSFDSTFGFVKLVQAKSENSSQGSYQPKTSPKEQKQEQDKTQELAAETLNTTVDKEDDNPFA